MDATRLRRTRDRARQAWYALWRSRRFARHMGFPPPAGPTAGLVRPASPSREHKAKRTCEVVQG